MIYATLAGKVYRFTPERYKRFLWRWSNEGQMPDLEKAGKLVGEGIVKMDGWTIETARDQLVAIISGKVQPVRPPTDQVEVTTKTPWTK